MDQATRRLVQSRAGDCCEYCGLPAQHSPVARLQIEHIRPRKHDGTDDESNLALACIDCNLRKGSNLTGIDPESDQITELFNPRTQRWEDHFVWYGVTIIGLTDVGRATIKVMELNSDDRLVVRSMTYRS
jgi:5-methylcytosine-specific restriction endonuclease McrA